MNTWVAMMRVVLPVAMCAAAAAAQPEVAAPLPAWIPPRLTTLGPGDPSAYFLLGEEVAGEAESRGEEDLARHLFGLAFELDRRDGTPTWIAPSSCLAIASLARLESDQRWLRALASRLDSSYAPPAWRSEFGDGGVSEVAFDAAEAIGEVRAGNGIHARELLQAPGVRDVILRYGQLLGFSAATGALWQVEQWASEWPCRECGNERVVFRPNTDPPSYRECYTCRGNPGPKLTQNQIIAQLRFESRLLHGISRSWGAQLSIDYGAPLREPSPEELATVLGIDVSAPFWRGGAWVKDPEAKPAPQPGAGAPPTVGGSAQPSDVPSDRE